MHAGWRRGLLARCVLNGSSLSSILGTPNTTRPRSNQARSSDRGVPLSPSFLAEGGYWTREEGQTGKRLGISVEAIADAGRGVVVHTRTCLD